MATAYPTIRPVFFNWAHEYYSGGEFEAEYRGFQIKKDDEYCLYYIVCSEDKIMPRALLGRYTKLSAVHSSIDRYLADNPAMTPDNLLDVLPPPRSHKKKAGDAESIEINQEPIKPERQLYIDGDHKKGNKLYEGITDNPLYSR